ncbi:SDR family NAD(P)-dependent oxidoreductase [Polyangium jinanense]|uniref:SDR family oxidoreductase n=1 Tax=Polyangium jinanense TaxID=2829994 RepID=A0A9X4ATZ4_9BACT|nr:SDR family oxidoreductase [Polyangium jinanense]MDC3957328.1 SDR family oxidoreductase [Polyangium jinanense]MDC3982730.1 SDR family oxidoreductase [Polyangium jinanense]
MTDVRRALVLGGSGYVGREVVRALAAAGARVAFTYQRGAAIAESLAAETGARSFRTNLAEPAAIRALFDTLDAEDAAPDLLVHSAVVSDAGALADVTDALWDEMHAVNVRSVYVAMQSFAARLAGRPGDVVLTAALDGIAKIPSGVHFAATQSARLGMTQALAKELGPKNVRVNLVLLGALGGGISESLDPARLADYKRYSALQRVGTPVEAARAITRLALHNRWMTGSVLPITGGL